MSALSQIIHKLDAERKRRSQEIARVDAAIKALGGVAMGVSVVKRRKPQFSKAGLARIAAAQRARWAKIKAAHKK